MSENKGFIVERNESTFVFRIDGNCKFNTYGGSLHEHYLDETVMVKNSYMHYQRSGISFAYGEIVQIRDNFNKLLSNEISECTEMSFLEPDFEFLLIPKRPNDKHGDVLIDFIIWIREPNGAYSDERYTKCFDRNEIEQWRDYLDEILELCRL